VTGTATGMAAVTTGMTGRLVLVGVGAGLVALVATPLAGAVARRTGVVDRPGTLKVQSETVPYLGGAAVFAAMVISGALGRPLLLLPLGLALILGVADDATELPPWFRLVGQVVIGADVAACVTTRLEEPFGAVALGAVTVLLINGVNMIDGLDTLAGGLAAVAGVAFAWMLRGDPRELGVGLACGLAGFLVYNRPPARIYLGDGGSYLLGTALAILLGSAWARGGSLPTAVAGLLVVAVPAAEVLFAVIRRLRSRRSVVLGDRGHPYDRLVARGWPPFGASSAYIGVELVLAGGAVALAASHRTTAAVVAAGTVVVALVIGAGVTGSLVPDPEVDR
jgi:UDP-GlcNAc:undecaprenyl-phosphate/decaprenyl-phosphate GlcNAc-1-phosphate transferase